MKKIKKLLISISLVLFLPLFLFACDEATFNSTPWVSSSKTTEEVTEIVENSRQYMMDDVNIPVTYETTTIFNFYQTEDESFLDKTVKKVTTATFSSASIDDATAEVVTKTFENDELISLEVSTYVRTDDDNGFIYTEKTVYATSSEEDDLVFRERQETNIGDRTFYTMLGDIVFEAQENEADIINEKSFENVQYYKLSSSILNLETIQEKFNEKSDLFANPELFAMDKKGEDYVMPFSYEYGITALDYISYFSMNYTIGNSNKIDEDNFETYLSVSSVTILKNYGNAVVAASQPENIDDFTVATFDNTVKSDEYYVVYREDVDTNIHKKITTQKRSDGDTLVKVEEINSGSLISVQYYYLDYEGSDFTAYLINVDNRTYVEQVNFSYTFLNFNYSLEFFTKTNDEAYQYGSNEAYYLIRMQNGEVYSIANSKAQDATITFILSFDEGQTGITLYDLTGLSQVE